MPLADDVHRRGLAATHELLSDGWTARQLSRSVAIGEIVRVRQGWYTVPETTELLQRAARVGGRLTCAPAARIYGLSAMNTPALHVAVHRNSGRLRSPVDHRRRLGEDAVIHWNDEGPLIPPIRTPFEVLTDMALCETPEFTIAAVDSAIRLGLIEREDWMSHATTLPNRLAALLHQVDGRSESITESLCRVRLRAIGIVPRLQVEITEVGRVDFVLGERQVVEVDGWEYHSDRERFENDRRRDALLSARGYRVLRFSYRQVMERWSQVEAAILGALARGDHLH